METTRRELLGGASAIAIALALLPALEAEASSAVNGQVCMGLFGPTYYGGFNPFLNWWKISAAATIILMNGTEISGKAAFDGGYLSAENGEISRPARQDVKSFSRIFSNGGTALAGETWTAKWEGSANCDVGGLSSGGQILKKEPGLVQFKMGSNPGNTWLTFTITDRSNPPNNIRIYQSKYASNVDRGDKFNPDWFEQIRNFGILRFMGWMPTNDEIISDFSQLANENYASWCQPLTTSSQYGPKGSLHPSLICQLASIAKCNIHVCIPHLATDAFVREFAKYFRDNLDKAQVVTFEYSNECWNWSFSQAQYCLARGQSIWPGDGARYAKWYGYRSAQCMKIISEVYNDRARWRGCLATQTGFPSVTQWAIEGAKKALLEGTVKDVKDCFDEVSVTGYFGDLQTCNAISNITNSDPAVVKSTNHGFVNGNRVRLFISTGITELNNVNAVVSNVTRDTFELSGVNSLNNRKFEPGNNYVSSSEVFELMDESEEKFRSNPSSFPTKYTHFNNVMAQSWSTGVGGNIKTSISIASLKSNFWPAQKAIAAKYNLELRQYEGGLHFVGDGFLTAYGGNDRFTEFLLATGHSERTAQVYSESFKAFSEVGGRYPSKFVEAGANSRYGVWAGLRRIPGDENNPVWIAVSKANTSALATSSSKSVTKVLRFLR